MRNNKKDTIRGITCTACNCVYNCNETNCCSAESVNIGPHSAQSKSDTVCATFKKNS